MSRPALNASADAGAPEVQLLLRCATTRPTPDDQAAIQRLVEQRLDLAFVIVTAVRHQVLPLLYRNLSTLCPDALPPVVLAQLGARFQQQQQRNVELARELLRFLELLRKHEIEAVPLKGPAVAVGVYGDLSLRSFRDLDFLLRPHDIRRAKELLAGLGYGIRPDLSGARERSYLRSECEWSMANPEGTACIEIHWAVRERAFAFPLRPEELWSRLTSMDLEGEPVRMLSREDLLLVLSIHGAKHCWDRLKWICDIAELLRAEPGLNWDQVLREASRLHATRLVLVSVQLAAELLGAPVPPPLRPLLDRDRWVGPVTQRLAGRLFSPPGDDLEPLRRQLLYLGMRERLQERGVFVASQFFTPTEQDWNSAPLPDWLFSCYHLVRPCRLAAGYALSGWKLAQRYARRSRAGGSGVR